MIFVILIVEFNIECQILILGYYWLIYWFLIYNIYNITILKLFINKELLLLVSKITICNKKKEATWNIDMYWSTQLKKNVKYLSRFNLFFFQI